MANPPKEKTFRTGKLLKGWTVPAGTSRAEARGYVRAGNAALDNSNFNLTRTEQRAASTGLGTGTMDAAHQRAYDLAFGKGYVPGGGNAATSPNAAASADAFATAATAATAAPYAEGDTTTTDLGGMRGKQYKGQGGVSRGATAAPPKTKPSDEPAEPTKKQAKNLKSRGKRQKSGTKPGFHISKSGDIVANKGKRRGK